MLRDKNLLRQMDGLLMSSINARKESSRSVSGLGGGKSEDAGRHRQEFGVTRERIRQFAEHCAAKLRRA